MNPDVESVNATAWGANGPSYGSVAIAGPMRGPGSVEEGEDGDAETPATADGEPCAVDGAAVDDGGVTGAAQPTSVAARTTAITWRMSALRLQRIRPAKRIPLRVSELPTTQFDAPRGG
jgi:hypothetical protein